MRGDDHPDGAVRTEHFSEPRLQPAQSGKQPKYLQRRVFAENTRHHARHCVHRRADCDCLYRLHLLDFSWQGKIRQI